MTYAEAIRNCGDAIVGRKIVYLAGAGDYVTGMVYGTNRLGAGYAEVHVVGHGAVHIPLAEKVIFA